MVVVVVVVVVVNIYEALLRMAKITVSKSAESVWAVFHAIILFDLIRYFMLG